MSKPLVTVACITYNQEDYITQALEGFISQDTDFKYEVIIGDDGSTDGTRQIIKDYAARFPEIIKPIFRKKNLGPQKNFIDVLKRARGDYIALCEGDDYWTDNGKLRLQVDFMNKHKEYAITFHPVRVFHEDKELDDEIYPVEKDGFSVESLLKRNFIQTNSVMYKKVSYDQLTDVMPFDWYLHLYHAQFGQIGFIDKEMSSYRRHSGGVWWESKTDADQIWKKYGIQQIRLFTEALNFFKNNTEYTAITMDNISQSLRNIARIDAADKTHLVEDFLKTFSENDNLVSDTIVALISEDEKIKSYQQYQINELTAENTELRDQIERIKNTGYYKLFKKRIGK